MKRLLIVADHTLVVQAIRLALRQTAGFQVVGFVDGRQEIRGALAESRPDVVLVDDMQNPDHPLDRLREITEHAPTAKPMLLTVRTEDAGWLDDAFEAGAEAVISKSVHPVALGTLLREIVQGRVVHRPRRVKPPVDASDCPLTSRELEILSLASQGMTNGSIA